jgi:UDP-glucose 4-epimerase
VADGHAVRVLVRSAPPAGVLPAGVDIVFGELSDPSSLRAASRGVQRVFHLAARLHVPNPPVSMHPEYERINVDGTRHLVAAAREAGADRFVFFSTISVYGPTNGTLASESMTPAPETIYARTKLAAEEIVRGEMPSSTVLRLAAVYGPRIKGNYRRLLDGLARGRFVPIGAGTNRRTLVEEDDVVRAAILAASHPAASGRMFNVTDGATPQLADIIHAMCRALGRRPPRWSLPAPAVRVAARLADRLARIAGRRLTLSAAVDKYLEEVTVDGRLMRDALGFQPSVSLDMGWQRTVAALRAQGEL